jgi:hypothetical protein
MSHPSQALNAFGESRAGSHGGREALRAMRVVADERRGHRVLKDELRQIAAFQHNGVFVERAHSTGDLDTVEEVHSDVFFAQERRLKERFLNVAGEHARSYLSRVRSRLESS